MHPVERYARASQAAYAAADGSLDFLQASLAAAGLSLVGVRDVPEVDLHCYAATDRTVIMLGFAGTRSPRNWARDLEAIPIGFVGCRMHTNAATAHQGFVTGWRCLRDWCASVALSYRSLPIVCTGHSLGGALATLAAVDLPGSAPTHAYTYGSPRVGFADFANCYDDTVATTVRVVHADDIVPTVPSGALFQHVRGELRLLDDGSVVGPVRNWLRGLLGWGSQIVEDIDGVAEHDHFMDRYADACAKYGALQGAAA